jgi:hypothetical protein
LCRIHMPKSLHLDVQCFPNLNRIVLCTYVLFCSHVANPSFWYWNLIFQATCMVANCIAKWLDYVEFTCTTKSLHLDVPCAKRKVLQSLEQFRIYTCESKLSTVWADMHIIFDQLVGYTNPLQVQDCYRVFTNHGFCYGWSRLWSNFGHTFGRMDCKILRISAKLFAMRNCATCLA